MKSTPFFRSKFFLNQVLIALGSVILLVWLTLWVLKWYTHHGEQLSVPDLHGMKLEDATKTIIDNKLKYEVIDSSFDPKYEPKTVLQQRPLAGAKVKRKRKLFLTINANAPEQIQLPNLVDHSFRQAYEILLTAGFKIGRLEYEDSRFFNLVLYPKINGDSVGTGFMVHKGATVDLVLGKGNMRKLLIPKLINEQLFKAKETIILSNLNVGKVQFDKSVVSHADSMQAKIFRQRPMFGKGYRVDPGSEVQIWLTTDSLKLLNSRLLLQQQTN